MSKQTLQDATASHSRQILIGHGTIIPGPFLDIIIDGAVAISDGKIQAVGKTNELLKTYPKHTFVDATNKIIVPGLFNAHTHVAMGFFRGLGHGRAEMIESFLFPAEKNLTPELLEPLSYSYIFDGLRAGVTSFADHYYFSAPIGSAFEKFRVRGWLGETIADLGGAFPGRDSFDRARQLIESSNYTSRIKHVIAPHAADTVSPQLLTEISKYARDQKIPLHMHLSQTSGELQRVKKRDGRTPVETAAACGALGPNSIVVHLVSANQSDLKLVAQSGATVGWCPASTVIYEKLAPIKEMFERGIPMAIATDCAASNDSADILGELRTGGLFARHAGVDQSKLSPDHLLAMATTIPAKALGVEHLLGTLAPQKLADLVVMDIGLSSTPIEQPLANVIYSMGARDVTHVMVDGDWVIWNRDLVGIDRRELETKYVAAVNEIGRRVRASQK